MENVRSSKAKFTPTESSRAGSAEREISQIEDNIRVRGLVNRPPYIASTTNEDIPNISPFVVNSGRNNQQFSDIIVTSDRNHDIEVKKFNKQLIDTVSKTQSSVQNTKFHAEKNEIQVMGQVCHNRPVHTLSQSQENRNSGTKNRKITHSDVFSDKTKLSDAEKAEIFNFGGLRKDRKNIPDGSGPIFEEVILSRAQSISSQNSDILAKEQALTAKDKLFIENEQISILHSAQEKDINVIAAKTKEFLKNDKEKQMLILKNVSTLQTANVQQKSVIASQNLQKQVGLQNQGQPRQYNPAEISRHESLRQNLRKMHIPVQLSPTKTKSCFKDAKAFKVAISPTCVFSEKMQEKQTTLASTVQPAGATHGQAVQYYNSDGHMGRTDTAQASESTRLYPAYYTNSDCVYHADRHVYQPQPSSKLLALRKRRMENKSRQQSNAAALSQQKLQPMQHTVASQPMLSHPHQRRRERTDRRLTMATRSCRHEAYLAPGQHQAQQPMRAHAHRTRILGQSPDINSANNLSNIIPNDQNDMISPLILTEMAPEKRKSRPRLREKLARQKQQQKEIFLRFQHTRFMFSTKKAKYRPYSLDPIYISSCLSTGTNPNFMCMACEYNTKNRSHFDAHHLTLKHTDMLDAWSLKQVEIQFNENSDQPITVHEKVKDKDTVHEKEKDKETELQGETSTRYPQPQIKVHERTERTSTLAPDVDPILNNLENIPIALKEMINLNSPTIKEIHILRSYEDTIKKITKRIPAKYRNTAIDLVATMHTACTNSYQININIYEDFLDSAHWIITKYHNLMKRPETRKHLFNKFLISDYKIIHRSVDQDEEIKNISGAARIMYDILITCPFASIEYLCMLAVLMDKYNDPKFVCSAMKIKGDYYLDTLLNTGVLGYSANVGEATYDSSCSIENNSSQIRNDTSSAPIVETFPNTIWSKGVTVPNQKDIDMQNAMINDFSGLISGEHSIESEELSETFQSAVKQDIIVQKPLDNDLILDVTQPETSQSQEWDLDKVMEEANITTHSDSDCDSASKIHTRGDGKAIYIDGMGKNTSKSTLRNLFQPFGEIIKINMYSSKRSATIVFCNKRSAKKAKSQMQRSPCKGVPMKISMAKDKVYEQEPAATNIKETVIKQSESYISLTTISSLSAWDELETKPQLIQNDQVSQSCTSISSIQSEWDEIEIEDEIDIKPFHIDNHVDEQNHKKQKEQLKDDYIIINNMEPEVKQEINEIQQCFNDFNKTKEHPPSQPHPPSSPVSSQASEPFHGFEPEPIIDHSPDMATHTISHQRLRDFQDNSWEIICMEEVAIPPRMSSTFSARITAENLSSVRNSLRNQNTFVLTCGLCPYPQTVDGVYYAQNGRVNLTIHNSSKSILLLRPEEVIKGLTAHTIKFVLQSLHQSYGNHSELRKSYNYTKWHSEAKVFKKMDDWLRRFQLLDDLKNENGLNQWDME